MKLRQMTDKPVIKAFTIDKEQDIEAANASSADYVLLDSGRGGTGAVFDWKLLKKVDRPYFLAGGLTTDNVRDAVKIWTEERWRDLLKKSEHSYIWQFVLHRR